MIDELDLVRAPVTVGSVAPATAGRPAIEARTLLPLRRPPLRTGTSPVLAPPDPLGVLAPDGPEERILTGIEPAPAHRLLAPIAAVVVLVALGVTAFLLLTGDDEQDGASLRASGAAATVPPGGVVEPGVVAWGPDPGVCPADQPACYTVGVELRDYPAGRTLAVACVSRPSPRSSERGGSVAGDRPGPAARQVTVDGQGHASTRVPCAEDRRARSIDITVDGTVAASVDLPTTIVTSPTVTVTADRPAAGEATCTSPACRYVDVVLTGFEPGAEVVVTCHASTAGAFGADAVTIGPDGTASTEACWFGYPGEELWVTAGEVSSERITWPGG